MVTHTSRRSFLRHSLSSAALVALAPNVPQFLLGASAAAAKQKGETVLVVIQLSGGNDGLNTVIPYGDDVYYRNRPLIGIAKNTVRKIDDYIGLHPAMEGFSKLLEGGRLGIMQGVGYPNPDRSHFSSMDIWHTARHDVAGAAGYRTTGWLGRYLDASATKTGHDIPGLHLPSGAARLPLAMVGKNVHATSVQSLEAFKLEDGGNAQLRQVIETAATTPRDPSDELVTFLQHGAASALDSSRQVQDAVRRYVSDTKYPQTGLGRRLKTVAQLIDAGLGTRIYYLDLDGFDTHANQVAAHAGLLAELSNSVTSFVEDLKQHSHDQRVMVMTFSEFGRRVHENASQGTDHGAAAPMFFAGGGVKPGLLSKHPSMSDLDTGDLKHGVDFRAVYAAVLQDWLNVSSDSILGGAFAPVPVTS